MKFIPTLICVVLMVASSFVNAQKPKKQTQSAQWASEPSSVFGIKLGQPLLGEAIPPCGGIVGNEVDPAITVCAMYRPSLHGVSIAGFPIAEFQSGFVILSEDIVTSILIEARRSDYNAVKRVLIERYGKPTSISNEVKQNRVGGKFNSEEYLWVGKNVTLQLDEIGDKVDQTKVFFYDMKSAEKFKHEAELKRKTDAAKM